MRLILLPLFVASLGCDRAPDPPPPPPDSYEAATFQYTSGNETRSVSGARVRPGFFGSAWTQPALGRVFVGSDYAPDAETVAIVSDAFWRESLNAAPTVIGGAMVIDGMPATLVGVLPRGAGFPPDARIWLPHRPQDR